MIKDLSFQCEDEKVKSSHLKSFLKTFSLISQASSITQVSLVSLALSNWVLFDQFFKTMTKQHALFPSFVFARTLIQNPFFSK
jgi:hypothetical protein